MSLREKLRRQPVLAGGRVQLLDTVARSTLRILSGSEEYKDADDKPQPAIKWFLDITSFDLRHRDNPAIDYQIFRVEDASRTFWRSFRARTQSALSQTLHVWLPSFCAFGANPSFSNSL